MQHLIGHLLVIGPYGSVLNLDTGTREDARMICLVRQLDENVDVAPLSYYEDPLYVIPEAMVDERGSTKFLWTGHADDKECVFVVDARDCYDTGFDNRKVQCI